MAAAVDAAGTLNTADAGNSSVVTEAENPSTDAAPAPSVSNSHPPYEEMILSALEALKSRRGLSWHAISKYITVNYSELPSTHATLLTDHLRQLQSKGSVRILKHCYKIAQEYSNRGRPRKPTAPREPKKRGRPPKLETDSAPRKKSKPASPKSFPSMTNGPVYIVSRAEQLSSGLLNSFPGAVAIVLPKSLLSEEAARRPLLILPKGIQSSTDPSVGKRKPGRPKIVGVKKKLGRPRKSDAVPKLHLGIYGVGKDRPGRPWKVSRFLEPGSEQEVLGNSGELQMPESVQGTPETASLEFKKRPVGRPRKNIIA